MPDSAIPPAWGLYLSVPFCRFKCTYCNFASGVYRQQELERYLDALCREIRAHGERTAGAKRPDLADSVYLGGGTPSMLSAEQIARLFAQLRECFSLSAEAEITLEAAPGSISGELARAWRSCGVNRISMGVQSFVERELRAVGRPHRAGTVVADIETLHRAGIENIGVDLIAGLPYQTAASWEESLDWVGQLAPHHASVYLLEIDEDSRLGAEALDGGARYSAGALPDEDAAADFYCRAIERLAAQGYRQYEISNFALPGRESRHNGKYWDGAPYLGFGVDAHSFDGVARWANADSLDQYLARVEAGRLPMIERRSLDDIRRAEERLFLGLRRNDGVALSDADRRRYDREINELVATGLLEFEDSPRARLRLTERGRLLSNEVFAAFVE